MSVCRCKKLKTTSLIQIAVTVKISQCSTWKALAQPTVPKESTRYVTIAARSRPYLTNWGVTVSVQVRVGHSSNDSAFNHSIATFIKKFHWNGVQQSSHVMTVSRLPHHLQSKRIVKCFVYNLFFVQALGNGMVRVLYVQSQLLAQKKIISR